jgi:glyoxylase-like metal-dependent hydrolase (beta-lactamase superfamily II)
VRRFSDDITDVFMTHLHFDHCGGSVQWNKNKTGYEPAFKNAKFWTNENHWECTNQIPGRKHHSCPKIFYQCKKADN